MNQSRHEMDSRLLDRWERLWLDPDYDRVNGSCLFPREDERQEGETRRETRRK